MKPADQVMQSYGRCCASADFFDDFYTCFLASSPLIREKFVNTNMQAQKQLLRQGIMNLVMVARGMPDTKLRALGETHCRHQMDIRPELYGIWVDTLLATISSHDPQCTDETLKAWRDVLNEGIAVITSHY
ncbi:MULTISPECIES: globin [unclassified Pseudomonas]|jgi:hemoglobin-like flavoprotein|uniref:globin n=1 Tax=unclassified Pseudomonas TaxID=196821 RepID=UPI002580B409|nr:MULTISPECIES: globin [unclassified Pseudomonas]